MVFKMLLISTLVLTFIRINVGMNHTPEADDQSLLFWSDVDKINDEIHGEPSSTGILDVTMDKKMRREWAQETFMHEYQRRIENKLWSDLRNEAYIESWPILCYLLWDKHPNMKKGQECGATRMYEPLLPRYTYRVEMPNKNRYQVDLLQCKCPNNSRLPVKQQTVSFSGLYFFVTPCAAFNNSYYIMKQIHRGTLDVYDIRDTNFSPNLDYNLRASEYEISIRTYGQPGHIATQNELTDEEIMEKWAQESFIQDYACCTDKKFIWPELRVKAYDQSWPALCVLLLGKDSDKKTRKKCTSIPYSEFRNIRTPHRILLPPNGYTNDTKMYADVLSCKCPPYVSFYVTKSYTFDNIYYIMRLNPGRTFNMKVYDIRSVVFKPQ